MKKHTAFFLLLLLLLVVSSSAAAWFGPGRKLEFVEVGRVIVYGSDMLEYELVNSYDRELAYTERSAGEPNLYFQWYEAGEKVTTSGGCGCCSVRIPKTLPPGGRLRIQVPLSAESCQVGVLLQPPGVEPPKIPALAWMPETPRQWLRERFGSWAWNRWQRHIVWTPWIEGFQPTASETIVMEFLREEIPMDAANKALEDPFAVAAKP